MCGGDAACCQIALTTLLTYVTGEGADMVAEADSDVEWTEDSIKKVTVCMCLCRCYCRLSL